MSQSEFQWIRKWISFLKSVLKVGHPNWLGFTWIRNEPVFWLVKANYAPDYFFVPTPGYFWRLLWADADVFSLMLPTLSRLVNTQSQPNKLEIIIIYQMLFINKHESTQKEPLWNQWWGFIRCCMCWNKFYGVSLF